MGDPTCGPARNRKLFKNAPCTCERFLPFLRFPTPFLRLLFFAFFFALISVPAWTLETVHIGVLAKRGPELALQKWSQTGVYLSETIPEYHFVVIPLGFEEIHSVIKEGQVDFVLANPAFYVELEKLYGVNRIATLINQRLPCEQTTTFGGVIFTRADRTDITSLADLQDKSFMAVDPLSFGGWIMAWREFHKKGIDPTTDFSSLRYGTTHDAVVNAVLKGTVDAGTVRSDTLERMAESGKIELNAFQILNQQDIKGFPFLVSTELYPEWPMAAIKTTPDKLSRLVASALLSMDCSEPAALASKSSGWTVPLNYQAVHASLLELKIGPYKDFGEFTLTDVILRYWRQIVLFGLAVLFIITVSFYILYLNRTLRQKKNEVDVLNKTLEAKVLQRTEKVKTLLDKEVYLREILRTVADINELLITSPRLDILLQESCTKLVQHGQYGYCWIGLLDQQTINEIYTSDTTDNSAADKPYALQIDDDVFQHGATARCIKSNKTVIDESQQQKIHTTPWHNEVELKIFQAVIALPLRASQNAAPLGALTIYTWRKEGCEPEEIAMLEELAGDIGFAVDSFRQRESVASLTLERTANYEETIFSFVDMIEQRDTYTAGHTERVARYCQKIAREMGIEDNEIKNLYKAAMLHDIGKIATPDSVLLKPGKLTHQDYDLIKLHAFAGYQMLSNIEMYKELAVIILHHHERYDGKGYPDRLQGEEIPLLARIMTVSDAFDAMTTNRIYKGRKEIPEALAELEQFSGSQFHPEVVKAAVKVLAKIKMSPSVSQLPETELEKKRFSYYFNDKLTGLYNEDYLKIILRNNQEIHEYKCLHMLNLQNVPEYNKIHGWEAGNLLFRKFATELQALFPETLSFRAYGNSFVILGKVHFELDDKTLNALAGIADTEVEIESQHMDLLKEKAYTIEKLEKLEILSTDS